MSKGIITVLMHTVEWWCTGVGTAPTELKESTIKYIGKQISEDNSAGRWWSPKEGVNIEWKIINPEADRLQNICEQMKAAMLWGDKMYKKLKWEDEEDSKNLNHTITNPDADKWKEIAGKLAKELKAVKPYANGGDAIQLYEQLIKEEDDNRTR